ncbi:MAG: EthD family reductase [Anaerolineae bacterium]|nr:EthD family reductase [Anaerolineae bacterium]MDW8298270.1 EthD family reductase [Anaerolineae bacterium]
MVKMTILFRQPLNEATFEQHYVESLALIEKMPNIQRRQACLVFGSPSGASPYRRILELYFEDNDQMDAALRSAEGTAAGTFLMRAFGHSLEVIFAEVYEE